jgi:hypothetical protein
LGVDGWGYDDRSIKSVVVSESADESQPFRESWGATVPGGTMLPMKNHTIQSIHVIEYVDRHQPFFSYPHFDRVEDQLHSKAN